MKRTIYSPFTDIAEGSTKPVLSEQEVSDLRITIENLTDDNILSVSEKINTFIPKLESVLQLYTYLVPKAQNAGIDTNFLTQNYVSLTNFLDGLDVPYDDVTNNSTMDKSFFNDLFLDFTDALYNVQSELQGQAGAAATAIFLSSNKQVFKYNSSGAPLAGQVINFEANVQNSNNGVVWDIENLSGDSLGNSALTINGDSASITEAQFSSLLSGSNGIIVVAKVTQGLSTYSDRVSIYKLEDGKNSISGFLTNEAHTVQAANNGTVSSFSNAGGIFKVFLGLNEVTPVFTKVSQTGITASIGSNGVYTITGMSGDSGTAVFRATYNGTVIEKVYSISKSKTGDQGDPGIKGDNSYVHYAYSDSSDGSIRFTTGTPSGHTYWGVYTDNVEADSNDPLDYTWDIYKGPANFGLVNRQNMTIGPDWVQKTGGTASDTDSYAHSTETFTGACSASFTWHSGNRFYFGLNTDPLTRVGVVGVDYSFYVFESGVLNIYKSGAAYSTNTTLSSGDVLQIHYDGSKVRFFRNGTQFVTEFTEVANKKFFLDMSINGVNHRISDIKWAAAGPRGEAGPTMSILADKAAFTFVNGALNPDPQTVTYTAKLNGVNTSVDWSTIPSIKTLNNSPTFTLSTAEMGSNYEVIVQAVLGGILYQARVSKIDGAKIQSIEPQADVSAFCDGAPSAVFKHNASGVAENGEFPRSLQYRFQLLSSTVINGVTWDYQIVSGNINGFIAGSTFRAMNVDSGVGILEINSMSSDTANIIVRGSQGTKRVTKEVYLSKEFAAPNTSSGAGAGANTASQSSGFSNFSGTSWIVVSNEITIVTGTTNLTAKGSVRATPAGDVEGNWNIEAKLQRLVGATWTDFGPIVSGQAFAESDIELRRTLRSPSFHDFDEGASITAGSTQKVRILMRVVTGPTETFTVSGNMVVEA